MANDNSRFHCEINSIKVEGMMMKFNIFGDTFDQVTADLEQVIAYITSAVPPSIAPKLLPPAISTGSILTKPAPPDRPVPAKTGTCIDCGSDLLEWVTGTRKDNHKPFAAFKCQECGKWQPEAKK